MNFPDPASIKISLFFDILEWVLCLVTRRLSLISQHFSLFWKAPPSLPFLPSLKKHSSLTWSRWEPPITTTQSTGQRGCWWPELDLPCASTFWDLKERDTPSLVSRLETWVWEHGTLQKRPVGKHADSSRNKSLKRDLNISESLFPGILATQLYPFALFPFYFCYLYVESLN